MTRADVTPRGTEFHSPRGRAISKPGCSCRSDGGGTSVFGCGCIVVAARGDPGGKSGALSREGRASW